MGRHHVPAGEEPGTETSSPAGHIPCVICLEPIRPDDYAQARCWTDPHGQSCAAHVACLRNVGEHEIGLR